MERRAKKKAEKKIRAAEKDASKKHQQAKKQQHRAGTPGSRGSTPGDHKGGSRESTPSGAAHPKRKVHDRKKYTPR